MTPLYFLESSSSAVGSFVRLNGVTLAASPGGGDIKKTASANLWLRPGRNTLGFYVVWPDGEPYEAGLARVHARVFRHDPAHEDPTPLAVLAELAWPNEQEPEGYPYASEREFRMQDAPPVRVWGEADRLEELTEDDRREILRLVEALRSAMEARSIDDTMASLEYKVNEHALADGDTPESVRDSMAEMYSWMFGLDRLESQALDPDVAFFQIVADGQLVLVSRLGGEPAVLVNQLAEESPDSVEPEPERSFGIPIYAARIGGDWVIAR